MCGSLTSHLVPSELLVVPGGFFLVQAGRQTAACRQTRREGAIIQCWEAQVPCRWNGDWPTERAHYLVPSSHTAIPCPFLVPSLTQRQESLARLGRAFACSFFAAGSLTDLIPQRPADLIHSKKLLFWL